MLKQSYVLRSHKLSVHPAAFYVHFRLAPKDTSMETLLTSKNAKYSFRLLQLKCMKKVVLSITGKCK